MSCFTDSNRGWIEVAVNKGIWSRGFSIPEILTVVAVIAILAAAAIVGYNKYYVARARAADIVTKYDAIRSGVGAELASASTTACADLVKRLGDANLKDAYAQLAYGFEAVPGGFRPVLTVCAKADTHGAQGVQVARGAHDTLVRTGKVEKSAVLTEMLVSFAAALTDSARPVCTVQLPNPPTACGATVPAQPGDTKPAQTTDVNNNYGCSPNNPKAVSWGLDNCNAWYAKNNNACGAGQIPVIDWPRAQPPGAIPSSCSQPCKPGEVRDSLRPSICRQPAHQQSAQEVQETARQQPETQQPGQQQPVATQQGGSQPSPQERRQICLQACRQSYPHGNSKGFRECESRCN